jgi:hypothetical protein
MEHLSQHKLKIKNGNTYTISTTKEKKLQSDQTQQENDNYLRFCPKEHNLSSIHLI